MNYRELFTNLVKSLEKFQGIDCMNIGDGQTEFSESTINMFIEGIEEILGVKVPNQYSDYIHLGDGFNVNWSFESRNLITGEFDLVGIQNILTKADDTQLWHDEMSGEEIELYKSLQTIDVHGSSGDGQYAALRMEEGNFPTEIWFIDREESYLMNIDYKGYLDALLQTRGLHGWQYFFLDDYTKLLSDDYHSVGARQSMENVLNGFKQLFTDTDITPYQEKYDKLFVKIEG